MKVLSVILLVVGLALAAYAYDPDDKEIETIIPEPGTFEAFYPRETSGKVNSVSRASHNHGSFFQNRNPGNCNMVVINNSCLKLLFFFSIDWC